jgi:glycosyltransferase involved in cell wall biosynthesis
MRPHVLYVTPIFGYPAFGGPRLRTYNTLKALARCADVSLYLTDQPDTADRTATREHLQTFLRDVVWPAAIHAPSSGVARRVVRALLPAQAVRTLRRLRPAPARPDTPADDDANAALVNDIAAWVAAQQPDAIWLGFGGISYQLVALKQRTGLPLVLETECVWSRFVLRELPFVTDQKRRVEIQQAGEAKQAEERLGGRRVDVTTAVSDVDAEYFRSLAVDPTSVLQVSNVIDVDAYQVSEAPARLHQPALIFAGSLSRGTANVDATCWLVDEVMPRVWAKQPKANLYLVGRAPAPEVVARKGRRVHITGEVPSIVPYMRACAAAVVPLRWESGTRFKILEAFACRAPVVSTTLGAEGLAVDHGTHLLLADETDAFAQAILALVDEPDLGKRLTGPAYELVRSHYDISTAERQIAAVLMRLGLSVTSDASVGV